MFQDLTFAGRLGRDPETRYTQSGMAVTSFSVASDRVYRNANNETVKETTWFRCSVWGKQAETAATYLKKGSKILVQGVLKPDAQGNPAVFTRSDGSFGASYEVTVNRFVFLDGRDEQGRGNEVQGGQSYQRPQQAQRPQQTPAQNRFDQQSEEFDIPF